MKIEKTQVVEKSQKSLFDYLSNPASFKDLMPSHLEEFSFKENHSFTFKLSAMPEIALQIKEKTAFSSITYGSFEGKTPFNLYINLSEIEPEKTEVQLTFSASLNPMMTLMVKSPIENLLNTMLGKL